MMTVREIIEKVDQIELLMKDLKCSSVDLDYDTIYDILDEYRDVLLDKTVK